jgi:LmbE family N-acetylglucosaminyl deacetylase
MLPFNLSARPGPLQILCLGAHSDDLEIGCGGTVLRFLAERDAAVHWVVLGCSGERSIEAQLSAESLLAGAKQKQVEIHRFRDGFFPYVGGEIKEAFEQLKGQVSPDLIFTHTRADLHQDHRLVNELTWNTFRDHLILEYEIPKYDGDLGLPNLFVALDEALVEKKIRPTKPWSRKRSAIYWTSLPPSATSAGLKRKPFAGFYDCAASRRVCITRKLSMLGRWLFDGQDTPGEHRASCLQRTEVHPAGHRLHPEPGFSGFRVDYHRQCLDG